MKIIEKDQIRKKPIIKKSIMIKMIKYFFKDKTENLKHKLLRLNNQ